MHISGELVVFVVFGCVVVLIFGMSVSTILRVNRAGWRSYRFKVKDYVVLFLGFVGLCCVVWGAIEPYSFEVTNVQLRSDKFSQPFRLVHLSDLHCTGTIRTEKNLPAAIRDLHPDIIVFSGDATDSLHGGLTDFRELMRSLTAIAPTFAVYGNHDCWKGREALYKETAVHLLNGDSEQYTIKGDKIWIGGVGADFHGDLHEILDRASDDSYRVFVYHYPVEISDSLFRQIDLVCAGHTHGGQIRLPVYGALLTLSHLGKKYEAGLYRVNNTAMYVSRGIGMTFLPVRFLCKPEVTAIDITPSETH